MTHRKLAAALLLILIAACVSEKPPTQRGYVRQPAVAGQFYPPSREQLSSVMGAFLKSSLKIVPEIIIAPHAGYVFSGSTASEAFSLLENSWVKNNITVFLIGPSHHDPAQTPIIMRSGAFRTPLGDVPVNGKKAAKIYGVENLDAMNAEHSLEVELPFLQKRLSDFDIVPILTNSQDDEVLENLANSIRGAMELGDLVVISTDMAHYLPRPEAETIDFNCIRSLGAADYAGLKQKIQNESCQMCGASAVLVGVKLANNVNSTFTLVSYSDSGNSTAETSSVVGYASLVSAASEDRFMTSLARRALEDWVRYSKKFELKAVPEFLKKKAGVFVTLNEGGQLRGCIGYILPVASIYEGLVENAINAALHDPRFLPVSAEELEDIELEVTLLGGLEDIESDPDNIEIGKHGLYITQGGRGGVLLPQVPVEFGWSAGEFLSQTCNKANLPTDCWKTGARVQRFTGTVIKEKP